MAAGAVRHLKRRSGPDLHALRKSLKKLRYGVEFFAPVYASDDVKAFLKRCKRLQEELGAINDIATSAALGRQLADGLRPDLNVARAALALDGADRRANALRRLRRQWQRFSAQDELWC